MRGQNRDRRARSAALDDRARSDARKSGKENGDLQKVDVGIGLAHFVLMAREEGLSGTLKEADPGIALPADTEYVVSWVAE